MKFDANLVRNSRSNSYSKPPLPKKKMSQALVDNYVPLRAENDQGHQLRTAFTPRDECQEIVGTGMLSGRDLLDADIEVSGLDPVLD